MNKDTELLKRLLATFKVEAQEHLTGITSGLVDLEGAKDPKLRAEVVEVVFREVHSLKGAARAVNLQEIESLCQAIESVFSAMKKREIHASVTLFDLMQEAADLLGTLLSTEGAARCPEERSRQVEIIRRLQHAGAGKEPGSAVRAADAVGAPDAAEPRQPASPLTDPVSPGPAVPSPLHALSETVRVSTSKLTSVLLQTEEMLSAKLAADQRVIDMKGDSALFAAWKKEWAKVNPLVQELRSASRQGPDVGAGAKGRAWAKLVDFLDWNSSFVKSLDERFAAGTKGAEQESRALGSMVNNLLDDMKQVLMFPFSSLLEILPKIVRDLSRDSGKEAELVVRGEEIEVDRRILEEIKDPLVHLVRNCIDHGIEKPAERLDKGKPRQGTVTVSVSPRDDKVELVVADDGAGINLPEVRSAALRTGSLSPEKAAELADHEMLPYVLHSGVSTSPIITELSGRGLGLAIVKEKVEKLGGTIAIETATDAGSSFRIVLPLTVATFRGVTVRVGERLFVIPTMYVERALRLSREEIRSVENRETIGLNGEAVSLARLSGLLGLSRSGPAEAPDMVPVVVLNCAGTRMAFLADEVLAEQDVLLKSLGRQLSRVRNVAGATVLGNGRVVPILNVPDLMKSAVREPGSFAGPAAGSGASGGERRSVLVVEDSITTRTLLKNILEGAGYEVVTAVDGVDAFTRLKSKAFDIVVSDVDMPRMNGFDLTAKIRGDKALGGLPVVLVTALASREDRERGIDVGANAYIVKGSFDQSNLLEVVNRLM